MVLRLPLGKDPGQANEALDTMNQAETAANSFGVRGLPDETWTARARARDRPRAGFRAIFIC